MLGWDSPIKKILFTDAMKTHPKIQPSYQLLKHYCTFSAEKVASKMSPLLSSSVYTANAPGAAVGSD